MIAEIGTHPKEFIKQGQKHLFVKKLVSGLEKFARAFAPRPIVYRATDFKTNEYRNLKGGALYEPHEENPMIGYRGASRYIADPEVFSLELDALKEIWGRGYHNMHLMIPFVRVPWEMVRIRDIVRDSGLLGYKDFKLWMMVEVPSAAIMLEEFIDLGIHGVSIGTNDLTMMLLGVDRDSSEVANIYDERHPAVISVLEHIVETCSEAGITCSICGQAASDYPEIIEKLVRKGITSVSVNPDAIHRTRVLIHDIEKKIHGD
jgi:pyruvate,water dikinase